MALVLLAATANAEFRWGPTAGLNVSNFYFKQNLLYSNQVVGPNVGVMGELMFPGIGFGMDFGLKYQMHGGKLMLGEFPVWQDDYGNETSWIHTLQIPISLRFKYTNLYGIERTIAPFAYAGPVFSFTLGHNKLEALEYSGGQVGVQVGLGGELWERLQVMAGYYWGLTYEIRTVKLDNISARPQGWQVNLCWLF